MKACFIALAVVISYFLTSCGSSGENGKKKLSHEDSVLIKESDAVTEEVMDGHNVAMAKMGKLSRAQQEVKRLLDSVETLPAKAKLAAAPLKVKLEALQVKLQTAEKDMNDWMEDFDYDTLENNIKERINYMTDEKSKVGRVKEQMLNSLAQADSVLRSKF